MDIEQILDQTVRSPVWWVTTALVTVVISFLMSFLAAYAKEWTDKKLSRWSKNWAERKAKREAEESALIAELSDRMRMSSTYKHYLQCRTNAILTTASTFILFGGISLFLALVLLVLGDMNDNDTKYAYLIFILLSFLFSSIYLWLMSVSKTRIKALGELSFTEINDHLTNVSLGHQTAPPPKE